MHKQGTEPPPSTDGRMHVPPAVATALASGATLAISISGGKDGQAALATLSRERSMQGWPGRMVALHADLGRFEWAETAGTVEAQARAYGAELRVVRAAKGDLLDRITREADRLEGTGRPIWPGATARYCTSDMKRDPLVTAQRQLSDIVIAVQGLRAEEGRDRARRAVVAVEGRATAGRLTGMEPHAALADRRPGERVVVNWLAIHGFDIDAVWSACGTSTADLEHRRAMARAGEVAKALEGWPCHPAYVHGASRLGCACCVLASPADIKLGASRHPRLADAIRDLERRTGQGFARGRWLDTGVHAATAGPTNQTRGDGRSKPTAQSSSARG